MSVAWARFFNGPPFRTYVVVVVLHGLAIESYSWMFPTGTYVVGLVTVTVFTTSVVTVIVLIPVLGKFL